jgi:hypothetical protein
MPGRQAPQGDPESDISAPISMDVAEADDLMESGEAMTARGLEEERQREARPRARTRVATYEIAPIARYEVAASVATDAPAEVVTDLPPAELGEVIFWQGHFWRVDAIGPAQAPEADARLIVSPTTDEPKPAAA